MPSFHHRHLFLPFLLRRQTASSPREKSRQNHDQVRHMVHEPRVGWVAQVLSFVTLLVASNTNYEVFGSCWVSLYIGEPGSMATAIVKIQDRGELRS